MLPFPDILIIVLSCFSILCEQFHLVSRFQSAIDRRADDKQALFCLFVHLLPFSPIIGLILYAFVCAFRASVALLSFCIIWNNNRLSKELRNSQHLPEHRALQVKWVLRYACRGHSDPQDVLLGRHIRILGNASQIIQVANGTGKM